MSYISTSVKIAGTKFDRRVKITSADKEVIIALNKDGKSYRDIAKEYEVDRRTIEFICNPQALAENKLRRKERGGWKQYYDKEYHRKRIMENRHYKQKLYVMGLIKTGIKVSYKIKEK